MKNNVGVFDCNLLIRSVSGEDTDAICHELADVIIDLDNLPYDFEFSFKKVGRLL